jgi:signal recognition particle subunit SEC65
MVDELTEYFATPTGYGPKLMAELAKTCANIPEEDRAHVCEVIREDNAPNFKVGVKAIADACRKLGVPFHKESDYYVPAVDWTCDACGLGFKYAHIVSYEDKHDRGIFDSCPRCGLPVEKTIYFREVAERQRGRYPTRHDAINNVDIDIYAELKQTYLTAFENRKRGNKYSGWMFDKKEDDDFTEARRREEIDAMKAEAHEAVAKAAAMKKIDTERGTK